MLFCGEGKLGVGSKRKGKGKEEDDGKVGEGEGVEKGWFMYFFFGGGKLVGWVLEEYIFKEKEGEVECSGGLDGRE